METAIPSTRNFPNKKKTLAIVLVITLLVTIFLFCISILLSYRIGYDNGYEARKDLEGDVSYDDREDNKDNDNDETDSQNLDKPKVADSRPVIWQTLSKPKFNSKCEDDLSDRVDENGYVFSLKEYPEIKLPKEGEHLLIESPRNYDIISGKSYDILDSNGDIYNTIYTPLTSSTTNKRQGYFAFQGSLSPNCDEMVIAYFDKTSANMTILTDLVSRIDTVTSQVVGISWSSDSNYLVISYVLDITEGYGNMEIAIVDVSDPTKIDYVKVSTENTFMRGCGSLCYSPVVYYDESKSEFTTYVYQSNEVDSKADRYTYDLSGILVSNNAISQDAYRAVWDSYEIEPACIDIEYKDGEVSNICTY